ncbi:hypothetical protein RHSIM_RhsimUnG0168600 [Rhododendron simsii]|uniref:Indole-3-acetic acid-amido synthetase GH3.9 n=1 Tax=Rhododendron simsii TaxID=118357 RepID=A0A834FWZ2_RHOSS|nr:hypothetical protein RHSIM_RhsimUnG0168600 [Rhododendron simsii]
MDGKKLEYIGEEALTELEKLTGKPGEVQESILKGILERNGETEYLNKYMTKGSKDVGEFKRRVSVIMYNRIRPYIQRIANGEDSSLITGHPITEMLCSSGTSAGEPKLMPSIAEDLDRRTFLYNLIMPIINQYVPGLDEGKAMYLYFVKAEMSTPIGLPARAAILCIDSNQSMYCQLLAGLIHRHQVLSCALEQSSPQAFFPAISFLECNWANMCNNIRTGHLDTTITDPACRSAMSALLLSPNPHLASEIEGICSRPSWKGIVCHLWPRAKHIEAVVTGSMAQYIRSLEYYSDAKLPLVCPMYASSECYFGVNLKPLCDPADVAFTLLPNMEEEDQVPKDKLVDLVDVRLGCYYELVVTTFAGWYRYRIGDVLQVTGFHYKAPQFRYICRRNVVLSIDTDKTNEEDLHRSIAKAKKLLEPHNALLVEYTSYADTSSLPGHHVIFWEIKASFATTPDTDYATVLQDCCVAVEEELDYIYRRCRAHDKSVGPLEIRVVKPGTFHGLMDLCVDQGGSTINQYKTPRCIKSDAALELLNSNVEGCFFSPRDPAWKP